MAFLSPARACPRRWPSSSVRGDLLDRVRTPRALAHVAPRWPRPLPAALLAAVPAALILLVAAFGPAEFAAALTEPRNVHDAFSRFITAVATASAIAVSVAALAMRREMAGIARHDKRHEANDGFRERVRTRPGVETMPVGVGDFMAVLPEGIAARAGRLRREASAEDLRAETMGTTLEEHLRALEARMSGTARRRPGGGRTACCPPCRPS